MVKISFLLEWNLFLIKNVHYLIFPFKLCPHRSELIIGARGRHNIVHNVNMNIVEDHAVSISASTAHVINNVAEDDAVLC